MVDAPKFRKSRNVLDEAKRMKILALLSNGSSRRTAACMVGCAPSTITYTAARDPQFAEEIARAERNVEIEALRAIRTAMRQERYWRAAAWVLERKNPDDFAPRPPKMFSQAEVCQLLSHVAEMLVGDLPEENCRRAIEWLDELMLGLRDEIAATSDAPAAVAQPPDDQPFRAEGGGRKGEGGGRPAEDGGLSQFSSDENGTVPFTAEDGGWKGEGGGWPAEDGRPLAASQSPGMAEDGGTTAEGGELPQFPSAEDETVPFGTEGGGWESAGLNRHGVADERAA
ncbi:MAG: hypothetical protein ABSF26_24765 [Thermoguttaceae bacterium]|jgi:hypothetical protein